MVRKKSSRPQQQQRIPQYTVPRIAFIDAVNDLFSGYPKDSWDKAYTDALTVIHGVHNPAHAYLKIRYPMWLLKLANLLLFFTPLLGVFCLIGSTAFNYYLNSCTDPTKCPDGRGPAKLSVGAVVFCFFILAYGMCGRTGNKLHGPQRQEEVKPSNTTWLTPTFTTIVCSLLVWFGAAFVYKEFKDVLMLVAILNLSLFAASLSYLFCNGVDWGISDGIMIVAAHIGFVNRNPHWLRTFI